jgi:zinc protease
MKNLIQIDKYFGQAAFAFLLFTFSFSFVMAQPAPSAPRSGVIPAVKEKKLANGLTVAVVERKDVPLVTVQLLVKSGASSEDASKAGLADMTASMLTKGTKTRTATQIAEQMEFLGGSINTGAGWNNSVVTLTVTSDKLDQAMAIMADVVLNPAFDQKELDLLKSQALDGLKYSLTQPGFLATYAASRYSFDEHPVGGTPGSLASISRNDVTTFAKKNYVPKNAVLIFAGDIDLIAGNTLTRKYFGKWMGVAPPTNNPKFITAAPEGQQPILERILVVDLPNSGQAAVSFTKQTTFGRNKDTVFYYPSAVLNSVLGGGYSSRLNQEIRIKRGLSYGAGSSFAWRPTTHSFSTRTQTKNESAAEVAELVLKELTRLSSEDISATELVPRKSVLTGSFGRELETTAGLVAQLSQLYVFGIPTSELNSYLVNIQTVPAEEIKRYALYNINRGDIIIVGDYSIFKDDLAKRFPNVKVDVIKAAELDISKEGLRK